MSSNTYMGELAPAAHSRKKSEMWSALAELGADAEFWPEIVARISDGEFLSTLAGELKVNHSILRNWIRGDKGREQAFGEAEKAGLKARIERVMRKVHETAVADVKDAPTRMEALRAAEIMLKQSNENVERAAPRIGDINIVFVEANNGKPLEKVIDPVS
jgi:transposase-like protein